MYPVQFAELRIKELLYKKVPKLSENPFSLRAYQTISNCNKSPGSYQCKDSGDGNHHSYMHKFHAGIDNWTYKEEMYHIYTETA